MLWRPAATVRAVRADRTGIHAWVSVREDDSRGGAPDRSRDGVRVGPDFLREEFPPGEPGDPV